MGVRIDERAGCSPSTTAARATIHSTTRATIRALLVALAVCATAIAVGTPALAAGPSPSSLSDTEVSGTTIRTVLTVPATTQNVTIKAGSVTATLGGKPVKVTVSPWRTRRAHRWW